MIRQVLDRLKIIHDKHWIHMDIKPHNILLGFHHDILTQNTIHLIDFGLTHTWEPNKQKNCSGIGTLAYQSIVCSLHLSIYLVLLFIGCYGREDAHTEG